MNSRLASHRFQALHGLCVSFALTFVADAAIVITQTQLEPEGQMRVLFTDEPSTSCYVLEGRPTDTNSWSLVEALDTACIRPPLFQVTIPVPVDGNRFYRVAASPEGEPATPLVTATEPADGATSVSTDLTMIRVTFDRVMAGPVSWSSDQLWGGSYATWSQDRRTVQFRRFNSSTRLPALTTLRFTLNPNGRGFSDEQGNVAGPYTFSFTTAPAAHPGAQVTSSAPVNNALEVDPLIDTIELRFSESMMATGGLESSGWWPWKISWSSDGRSCYVRRDTAGTPIYGQNVYLRTLAFRTASGQAFTNEYTLRFQTADPPAIRVEASPAQGFYWPYLLLVPPQIEAPATLLIEPNNTGTWSDDPWVHESSARNLVRARSSFAANLGCPLLVPVFPRPVNPAAPEPGGIYIHALDRYSLSGPWTGLERVDLQLVAMIDDARDRLDTLGHPTDDRVFMMGFSASGAFTSRFTLLHPDRVKAAAPGSPGGWPLAPVASWQGVPLKYAVGLQDLEELTGERFDLDAFRQVALYIYVGDVDTNDALDVRGLTTEEKSQVCQLVNCSPNPVLAARWPLAEAMYDSVGADAQFVVYPGVAHTITSQMFTDIAAFFSAHR
jgi:pimeloyl-ACP methyl ester carboxylesterase